MNNKYLTYFILLLVSVTVEGQIVNIPDNNFKNALLNQSPTIDLNNDNEIQVSEANNYTNPIDVTTYSYDLSEMIFDFTGIESFTSITEFYAHGHDYYSGSFDFSFNTNLTIIDIGYCDATSINIASNNNLVELNISGAEVNSFSVSHLTNLEVLTIRHTDLSSIDLSQNVNLRELSFFGGEINSIDLSNNLALEKLSTGGAPLSSLDLTNNVNLKELEMQSSDYSTIDLSQNINLERIACYGSNVLNFDLSSNIKLKSFGCGNNIFTSLDFSNNVNLERFVSQGNNNLQFVNLKNGNNSNMTNFSALEHPNLTQVCVDDINYATNNFTNIDDNSVFDSCETLSLSENNLKDFISIYPNPIKENKLNIHLNSSIKLKKLSIISSNGKIIKTIDADELNGNNHLVFNVDFVKSNIFFVRFIDEHNSSYTKKIFK